METVDGAENSKLKPAQIKLVVLSSVHMTTYVVRPPGVARVGGRACEIGLELKALPGADGIAGESKGETVAAETGISGKSQGSAAVLCRVECMVVVQRPEGIKAGNLCLRSLLPVYPPEVNTLALKRMMKNLKISFHELGVGGIKGDGLFLFGISSKAAAHLGICILKEANAL